MLYFTALLQTLDASMLAPTLELVLADLHAEHGVHLQIDVFLQAESLLLDDKDVPIVGANEYVV